MQYAAILYTIFFGSRGLPITGVCVHSLTGEVFGEVGETHMGVEGRPGRGLRVYVAAGTAFSGRYG